MSLDRLIRLSQKTGDKLIVHDPIEGNDVVIMSVDAYEYLLDIDTYGELDDNFSPWDEDFIEDINFYDGKEARSDWHSTADVLEEKASDFKEDSDWMDLADDLPEEDFFAKEDNLAPGSLNWDIDTWQEDSPNEMEINTEGLSMEKVSEDEIDITSLENTWEEQKLSDEPVFYEEPV